MIKDLSCHLTELCQLKWSLDQMESLLSKLLRLRYHLNLLLKTWTILTISPLRRSPNSSLNWNLTLSMMTFLLVQRNRNHNLTPYTMTMSTRQFKKTRSSHQWDMAAQNQNQHLRWQSQLLSLLKRNLL